MGKSGSALLAEANKLASEKAKLNKKNLLSDDNKDKLTKAIDRKVKSAITTLTKRPRKASKRNAPRGLFSTSSTAFR